MTTALGAKTENPVTVSSEYGHGGFLAGGVSCDSRRCVLGVGRLWSRALKGIPIALATLGVLFREGGARRDIPGFRVRPMRACCGRREYCGEDKNDCIQNNNGKVKH